MNSGHRFHVPTLHAFIRAVFHQMGSNELEARLVADHLIASNLAGHDSHGIGMIPSYIRSFSQGHLQINRHAKVVNDAGAVITLDGDCAFGQVAAHEAITLGIEKRASTVSLPWHYIIRTILDALATGRSNVRRRVLFRCTL